MTVTLHDAIEEPRAPRDGEAVSGHVCDSAHLERSLGLATAALAAAHMRERDFVRTASHELRTPLSVVTGYLELVLDTLDDDDPSRRHLARAYEGAVQLVQLVDDLVAVKTLDADSLELDDQIVTVGELVGPLVADLMDACAAERLQPDVSIEDPLASVHVDPTLTRRGLAELLANAVAFTPAGGHVRLRVRPDARWVAIAVIDSGPGIAATEIEDVTDRFFRGEEADRQAVPGAGLGLTIAKGVAEAQGGRLELHSDDGRGTAATVWLPRVS